MAKVCAYAIGARNLILLFLIAAATAAQGRPAVDNDKTLTTTARPLLLIESISANANPTNAATVNYTVTFSGQVTGLSAGNFGLVTALSDASVGTPVNNGDNTWTVPVNTGTGSGTIQLSFTNAAGLNAGVSNDLPFEGNEINIDKTPPTIFITKTLYNSTTAFFSVVYPDANLINISRQI